MLYSEDNRTDDNKIAGLIRNSFLGKEYSIPELEEYSYYLRLQDMIDFKSLSCPKTIRTTKIRELKISPGLINYKLSDKIFEVSIGNRVLSSEIIENGNIPIISANVFEEFGRINKQNITDFSLPSIIWGIDGDWMVNIIPANTPFYPTDHCGVLRIHSTEILPQYMAIALEVAGTFEKFSRSNRASSQRIKNLIVQVPSLIKQQKIVNEISQINDKIVSETQVVSQLFIDAQAKFTEMFGTITANEHNWNISPFKDICEIITDGEHQTPRRCGNGIYLLSARNVLNHSLRLSDVDYIDDTEYLRIAKRIEPHEGDVLISCSGTIGRCTVLPKGIKCQMVRSVALLRFNTNINPFFAEYMITSSDLQKQIKDSVIQQAQPNLFQGKIQELIGFVPPIQLQNEFADYINHIIDKRNTSQAIIDTLNFERKQVISKYFD